MSPLSRTLLLSTLPTDQVLSFLELNSLIWTSLRFCRFEGALASLGWHLVLLKPIFKSLNFDLEVPKFLTWLRREYFSVNKWLQSLIILNAKNLLLVGYNKVYLISIFVICCSKNLYFPLLGPVIFQSTKKHLDKKN